MSRYRIVINPAARNGSDMRWLGTVREAFARTDHAIVVPGSYDALCQAVRSAIADGVDTVVVVGGDGTLNAVANQLVGSPVALAVVPAGTANDLARQLGVPLSPRRACEAILAGERRAIDLAKVNGQYFVTGGGLGVVSEVAVGVNGLKTRPGLVSRLTRTFGGVVYMLYSFGVLAWSRQIDQVITLAIDGVEREPMRAIALFVNNQATIGRSVTACPGTRPDDGRLGFCLMARRHRLQSLLTATLFNLGGSHGRRQEIELGEGRQFEVRCEEPMDFIGDGELLAQSTTLRIEVVPGALQVVAPAARQAARTPHDRMAATSK